MAIYQNIKGIIKKNTKLSQNVGGIIKTFFSFKVNVDGILKELLDTNTYTNKMRYTVVVVNRSASPPTTTVNTYQTPEMVTGFRQQFSASVTAIAGNSTISTVEPAVMTEDCTMTLTYPSANQLQVYVNGSEVTSTTIDLVVGDEISISGSVNVQGASASTATAAVTITLS